ncbi:MULTISPECIES: cytochrome c oxidase subunit II [Tenacibaculum]|uniref:Cytochrome c oxidase subunit 2 n=2 Tax=Tenacibaculum TaxID=104267 RepID=A0AAE9MNS8_9FLAO|nr:MULTISPECIES: cytochrome c oxidase subunit II [Tenacibaculum]GFD72554.1 cytochrome c oxidase subunit II [Tenacibaculum sp. KUL113]GFD78440.1 cytochrome c oxidase subunit II [Tenacibaculum sp. KUL118]GFE00983.1 cytochrome c oxidase subunit II [Alteromonas sp. KUL156]AZJ32776.1 cytochrome c oxidase subunit II [Tenacibaculum mesophilum]KAF9658959.1 cytochrome c oxidase subunit II [Tenacibaculum mesophilum]|eukprot:TRINITY_DN8288_c0_g1_i2.p1 TRINITY_DN8288_c0_g1~~TRINITY_DN8288_c0_g1_i2.p1  ORF type:complete len:336 (-),score=56.32 TRINITY_DN8288_c0_g1_i2:28-1035(-)
MLALFYIFIAVAIGVSFWQITRIMNFRSVIATDEDNEKQAKYSLAFLAFLYAMMIYCLIAMNVIMLPEAASFEGEHDDNLFNITFWLIGIVQFGMQFLIFFFTYKYRGNKNNKALFYADSHKLELIWTTIPAVTIVLLIGYGLWAWNNIMYVGDDENPIVIEVYSQQFRWDARYAGEDNQLGLGNVNFIKGINTMGVDMSDPSAQDDKQVTELYLPKGKKVLFKFRSQDVLHSAYMPHFRAQMNCVPGMVTQFAFTPKYTTAEMRQNSEVIAKTEGINKIRRAKGEDPYEFDYLLLCNKICGASHYNMQMKITVVEEEEYNKWLSEQKTLAQVIK